MKNMENALEKMDKCILSSLSFLDNKTVFISIVFILFLYNTCLFSNINKYVGNIYEYHVVKVIILLLIIYVSRKSYLIGILLALSFVISLTYNSIIENFISGYNSNESTYAEVNNESNESFVAHHDHDDMLHKGKRKRHLMGKKHHRENMDNMMKNSEMEELMNGSEESKESFSNNLFMNQHHENRNMDESDEVTSSDCLNNYMPKYEGLSNLCNTVSTFENSLDAQGLNHLNGYEKQDGYLLK